MGFPTFVPTGLSPAEYTNLSRTHNHAQFSLAGIAGKY